jgi:hypothetical protein
MSFYLICAIFIAAVALYLSPSMKALEKYFSRLQWFKTKKKVAASLNCNFFDTALLSQKDPLTSKFILYLSTKMSIIFYRVI